MSPFEEVLAEIRSTTCNNVEKRIWLEAKGTVRRLGEIPQREIFPSRKCVIIIIMIVKVIMMTITMMKIAIIITIFTITVLIRPIQ